MTVIGDRSFGSCASITVVMFMLGASPTFAGMIDESQLQPWENCALCHSLNGISAMAKFPKLAGQKAAYIEKQIRDFRSGQRSNDGGQMTEMASLIEVADIPIAAKYFSELKAPTPEVNREQDSEYMPSFKILQEGDKTRNLPACLSCHGGASSFGKEAPYLEAQHAQYIAKQLRDFKSNARGNDDSGIMREIASKLNDEEIENLGNALAALPRPDRSSQ